MIAHQPGDQFGVVVRQSVFQAKCGRVDGSKLGVIAAATFGDIVEQACEVGDLRLLEGLHQRAAMRIFVIESRQRKTTQVADHEQGVLVHGVSMKQVILHAPDDAAEWRNVQAQNAIAVHAAQFVGDPGRRAQDIQEQSVVPGILAELFVDQEQVLLDQGNRVRAHPFQVAMFLQQLEQFQQG